MRSTIVLSAVWVVATGAAATVAWQAIALVDDDGSPNTPLAATSESQRGSATVTTAIEPAEPVVTVTDATSPSPPVATTPTVPPTPPAPTASVVVLDVPATTVPVPLEFALVGGTVAARFGPDGVTVEWAVPQPGFDVEIEPEDSGVVKVEFRSGDHRSRIDLWWQDGPQHSIRERAG